MIARLSAFSQVSTALLVLGTTVTVAQARPHDPVVTAVVNNVQAVSASATRALALHDTVSDAEMVKTSPTGRIELTFPEKIVARLPANTAISFKGGTRNLQVTDGAALLQTPWGAHGARLVDGSIAIALSSTTIVFEHHPSIYKLLVLQGTARLYQPDRLGESMLVQPGQMVIGNPAKGLSDAVDFDTAHFVQTCHLISDFAPLASARAIARVGEKQSRAKGKKNLIQTNLVIFGSGTAVSLVDPAQLPNAAGSTAPVGPTPAPPLSSRDPESLGAVDTARGISR